MILNLLIISLISFIALAVMVSFRVLQIRGGKTYSITPTLYSIAEPKIEKALAGLMGIAQKIGHFISIHSLTFARNLLSLVKYVIIRIEKKFSRVINSVRGKEELRKNGEASDYFKQIRNEQ